MVKQSITMALALLSLSAVLAACGTPAPAPNNSQNSGSTGSMHKKNTHGNPTTKKPGATSSSKNSRSTNTKKGTATHTNSGRTHTSRTGKKSAGTGSTSGTAAAKTMSLATLPSIMSLDAYNPHYKAYHEVSAFVNEMGYHWATQVPGIVYMTNNHNQVTAVEAAFPQNHGDFGWYDPPTPPSILNGSLAWYSQHLYFVPPSTITPGMSATVKSDLTSWIAFKTVNPHLSLYVKEPTPYHGYTVYGPPNGPGIKVLVSPTGPIAGFLVSEPAMWGWNAVYLQPNGHPVHSLAYGTAYQSAFMLGPAKAPATPAGGLVK